MQIFTVYIALFSSYIPLEYCVKLVTNMELN